MPDVFHGMYIVDLEDKIQAKDARIAALEKIVEYQKSILISLHTFGCSCEHGPVCKYSDCLAQIALMEKEIGK